MSNQLLLFSVVRACNFPVLLTYYEAKRSRHVKWGHCQVDCKCNEIVLSHYPRKMICAVLDVWLQGGICHLRQWGGHFSLLSPSFPFLSPPLPSPPLEVGPLKSRPTVSSPSGRNRIWCILAIKCDISWQQFQWFSWETTDRISCIR